MIYFRRIIEAPSPTQGQIRPFGARIRRCQAKKKKANEALLMARESRENSSYVLIRFRVYPLSVLKILAQIQYEGTEGEWIFDGFDSHGLVPNLITWRESVHFVFRYKGPSNEK